MAAGGSGEGGHGSNGQYSRSAEPKRGKIGISRIHDSENYELVHPRCVLQRKEDYEEGMELWKAGDPEGARDALRYALEGCGDNLWVHVALGKIAHEAFGDATLARGHFGYAYELVEKALPKGFQGRIPAKLPGNRPYFEAAEGLAACHDLLGQPKLAQEVRARANRLGGRTS